MLVLIPVGFFDVDYQSTIDISRVVLVNNNLANYPYLTEIKSVAYSAILTTIIIGTETLA